MRIVSYLCTRECQLPPLTFSERYLKIPFEVCGSPLWGIFNFISMKKILFSDKFGLTEAVLSGRKTQTRRLIPDCTGVRESPFVLSGLEDNHGYELKPKYKIGEIVTIAQSYKDAGVNSLPEEDDEFGCYDFPAEQTNGWNNKMFVRADLMPHQIRITNVRVERLQDISDEDCLKEGLEYCKATNSYDLTSKIGFRFCFHADSAREAYALLIDKVSGKGTFEKNPYVFVYDFELVK